jgi:CheY-like chemotaxis protein
MMPLQPYRRILIVEDNPVHRRLMENELRADYELAFAADSETALGYLKDPSSTFALVVLDSLIPARPSELPSTEEAMKVLDMAPPRSIVVVVSGSSTDQLRTQLMRFDVKRIFEKPFSLSEFRAYVDSLFPNTETPLPGDAASA